MKNYKLVYDSPSHYVLHDMADRKDFHIAKRGLDDATHEKIKNLPPMNPDSAKNYPNDLPDNRDIPGTDPKALKDQPQNVQNLSDGGDIIDSIAESVQKAFKTPEPTPSPAPTQEDKYAAIRKQNASNASGQTSVIDQKTYSKGGAVKLANGTPEGDVALQAAIATPDVAKDAALAALDPAAPASVAAATNPNLPRDFGANVEHNTRIYAQNAGLDPDKDDVSKFKTQAENELLSSHDATQAAAADVQKQTYTADVDKITADNQLRAKHGLEPIPVPPPPPTVGDQAAPQPGANVPISNQISVQPPSAQPGMGLPVGDVAGNYQKGINQEAAGIKAKGAAESAGATEASQALQDHLIQQEAKQNLYEQENADSQRHLDTLEAGAAQGKIDPNRYWNSKDTGGKVSAALGLIFGGIGAGLTHQPNAALEVIQKGIQNDIAAQVEDKSNKMSLYKVGLEKYRDARSAQEFATLQANALVAGQLQQIAQKTGSQTALATAQQMIGQLKAQSAPIKQQLDLQQAQMRYLNTPGQQSPQGGIDDQKLRTMVNMGFIPKEEVANAMKERSDYQQLSGALDHTDQVFKKALGLANATESALPGFVPTIRPSSREYEALRDSWLGAITKETEGRVTPQDIKLMEHSFPTYLDKANPEVFNAKLNNIKDMIRDKYKFGTLPTYGLINQNDPIVNSTATRNKKFTPGAPVK